MRINDLKGIKKALSGKRLKSNLLFSDENIFKLFGHEAADDESIDRLREYYVKNLLYERITADLKLRILVGHKGIGKSAMFKIAAYEDTQNAIVSVTIRPDDITDLKLDDKDFLDNIRKWKRGLKKIICKKIIENIGIIDEEKKVLSKSINVGANFLDYIAESLNLKNITFEPSKKFIRKKYVENKKVNVYIDDLDRGWKGREKDIQMISALINAIRDISNEEENIHFKVALRSDVYYLYRTSDESTDKIGGSVVWLTWTNHEILALLVKRVETFFGREADESHLFNMNQHDLAKYLHIIMEPTFVGEGHWSNAPIHRVLMSLIRKRPRDLVKLCTIAAQNAYERKSNIIDTIDWENSFPAYSNDRLLDTEIEYKSELPEIMMLMQGMKPSVKKKKASDSYVFTTDALIKKIESIIQRGSFKFANKQEATPKQLAHFLYKINFITARKDIVDGEIVRKYFEENNYLMQGHVDFGFKWEVHPAYRWALQPDNPKNIYLRLELLNFDS